MSIHAKFHIILGAPGAGKGTFANQISVIYPYISHISTGDIFRENISKKTELGLNAKSHIEKGELVPDEITIAMVHDRLEREDVIRNGFILDGFPRNLSQAKAIEDIPTNLVLLLEVPEDILIQRILGRFSCQKCNWVYNRYFNPPKKIGICDKCKVKLVFKQRTDDNEGTIKKRIRVFNENIGPILSYYEKRNLLKHFDSQNTLILSTNEIKKILTQQPSIYAF